MSIKTVVLVAILFTLGCNNQTAPKADAQESPQVQADEATSAIWIDVRTPREFSAGHLPGAINIPHKEIRERIAQVAPNKDQVIKLYCRSGRRSAIAESTLRELGYNHLSNEGGYEAIKKRLGEQ